MSAQRAVGFLRFDTPERPIFTKLSLDHLWHFKGGCQRLLSRCFPLRGLAENHFATKTLSGKGEPPSHIRDLVMSIFSTAGALVVITV